ncbi:unnamed protein product [Lathyrus oleraceus]
MTNKNDFVFDFQAKSSTDLRWKMKIKVETEKALKDSPTNQGSIHINTNVENIQKLNHQKQSKVEVSKKMVKPCMVSIQNNNKNRLDVESSKKTIEPRKVSVHNSNTRSQSEVEVVKPRKVSVLNNNKRQLEVKATKESIEPKKVFVLNNNTTKKLKSTVDHQIKGSIESQVLKNNNEQTKEILQSLNNTMNKS